VTSPSTVVRKGPCGNCQAKIKRSENENQRASNSNSSTIPLSTCASISSRSSRRPLSSECSAHSTKTQMIAGAFLSQVS
jgi:hypothetical protein